MKKLITIALALMLTTTILAQDKKLVHVNWSNTSPVITAINVPTGEILFSKDVKEPVWQVNYVSKDNVVYIQTRHYAYKLDAITGDVLSELQYMDIMEQKDYHYTDPNLKIIPYGITDKGIGVFYILMGESLKYKPTQSEYLKNLQIVKIEKFDLNTKEKDVIRKLDGTGYVQGGMPILYKDQLIFSKPNESKTEFLIEKYDVNSNELIETLTFPIIIDANEYELTKDLIAAFYVLPMESDNEYNITLYPNQYGDGKKFNSHEKFIYTYNVTDQSHHLEKIHSFTGIPDVPVHLFSSDKKYEGETVCDEKQPMPKAPEVYSPKGYGRKARAEAKEINDERLVEYKKALKEWQDQQLDDSSCELKVSSINGGVNTEMGTFSGTKTVSIYKDQYIVYFDGLDYVMYDLNLKKQVWSVSL